ncbi:hypothetical protein PIROE2DRAFT_17689 [Piromyces sp. E2]|nr:hypothetical protein PIROE2DRAFT_17689 [Piromyces sp. E2]|eukprot:OUM57358.1 hypothetical protein PIROE2DRAFT_17689 [Piromyces sp. E2]
MYGIISGILSAHLVILLLWIITDNISANVAYTPDYKEFTKCFYPKSNILDTVLNLTVLSIGTMLSYAIRGVSDNFKEQLSVPVYTYVVSTILMVYITMEKDINVNIQDFFNALGTIINTLVVTNTFQTLNNNQSHNMLKSAISNSTLPLLKTSNSTTLLSHPLQNTLKTSNSSIFLNQQYNNSIKASNSSFFSNQQFNSNIKTSNSSFFINKVIPDNYNYSNLVKLHNQHN